METLTQHDKNLISQKLSSFIGIVNWPNFTSILYIFRSNLHFQSILLTRENKNWKKLKGAENKTIKNRLMSCKRWISVKINLYFIMLLLFTFHPVDILHTHTHTHDVENRWIFANRLGGDNLNLNKKNVSRIMQNRLKSW